MGVDARLGPGAIRIISASTGGISRLSQSGLNLLVTLYALHLGANAAEVGILAGVGSLGPIVTSIPLGVFSDRIGARKAMIFAFWGFFVTILLYILANGFLWLLPIQLVNGLFRNATWISSQGYVTSRSQGDDAAHDIRTFGMITNLSSVIGPLVVGLMSSTLAYAWSFALLSVFALIGMGCALALPPLPIYGRGLERGQKGVRPASVSLADYRRAFRLLAHPGMRLVVACSFMRLFITAVKSTFVPVFLKELSVSNGMIGVLSSLSALGSSVSVTGLPWLNRRFRSEFLLPTALGVSGIALGLVPFFVALPAIGGLLVIQGAFLGLSLPLLMSAVAAATPMEDRGLGAGLRSTTNRVAQLTSPLLVGLFTEWWSLLAAFVVAMSLMVTTGIFSTLYARQMIALERRPVPKTLSG